MIPKTSVIVGRRYSLHFSLLEGGVLLGSFLFTSFLIFIFGVYVGKEVQAHKTAQQTRTVRLPVSLEPVSSRSELPGPALPRPLSTVPLQDPSSTSPSLTLPAQREETPTSTPVSSVRPTTDMSQPSPPVKAAPSPKEPPQVQTGRWSVQVQATTQESAARRTASLLRQQGYPSSVSTIHRQGRVWYRVRVGHFTSEEDARVAVARFRRTGTFPQAYLVSD